MTFFENRIFRIVLFPRGENRASCYLCAFPILPGRAHRDDSDIQFFSPELDSCL